MLEVGTGDSGGAGGSNSPVPRTLAEPSSPCPITLRYKHPLEWTASCNPETGQISVKRPTGSSISFQSSDGHAEASVSGSSRKLNYKVQKLNADKSPCTSGSPAYLDMVQSNGRTLRFSAATGKVVSMVSASGVETTAEDYSRQMKVNRHPSTGAIQSIWSKSQGLLQAVGAEGE